MNAREWWMPIVRDDGKLDWLCDHEGDYLEKIEALWAAYVLLQSELASVKAEIERVKAERDALKAHAEAIVRKWEIGNVDDQIEAVNAYLSAHPKENK